MSTPKGCKFWKIMDAKIGYDSRLNYPSQFKVKEKFTWKRRQKIYAYKISTKKETV